MGLGWQHILLFAVVAFLLFGRGKVSELMGDVAKGIKAFKKGMSEEESTAQTPKTLEHTPTSLAPSSLSETKQK
jgi:sec-independent protein translocase protein TatA